MRYMLLLHGKAAEFHQRDAERLEEALGFLVRFEDDLAARSELEWTEVLDAETQAEVVGLDREVRRGTANADAPLARVWVVRVPEQARAWELAGVLAEGIGMPIEVRECLPGAQRP
ncbi:YciI family protein [Leucobacter celer]|uniref:hypothetical protein n=1 Tax=Leucobacter celer TaxID=668625 RepID=UPI000AE4B76D|nr:hypothetical protein [Leucobacter celer]